MKTRTAGLLAACLIAAGSIALIGFLASRARPARTATGAPSTNIAPPDIRDLPKTGRGPDAEALMGGKGLFVQVMDRNDPTRLSSEIVSNSLEPLEAKNYRVDQPRAWVYLRDGRVVHIQSKTGRLHMPDRAREPDSGTLEGDVDIRLFARPGRGKTIDLAKDDPVLRAQMQTLQFDGSIGEVSTPDAIKITSARTDFEGRGLRLLINQALERIELLHIERDGVLRHRPNAPLPARPSEEPAVARAEPSKEQSATQGASQPDKSSPPGEPQPAAPGAEPAAAPLPPPPETFYHATFAGPVRVEQGPRSISEARLLEVWVHLVDNELMPGAIAETPAAPKLDPEPEPKPEESAPPAPAAPETPETTPSPPTESTPTPTVTEPGPPGATPPALETAQPVMSSDEVVMTWPGALEVRPLETRPAELARDEVALRFTAGETGPVTGRDTESSATVTADTIAYSATRRAIGLASAASAILERAGQGQLAAPAINIDLAAAIVDIPSPGRLLAKRESPDSPERTLSWNDNAQFQFELADGRMTDRLRRATMIGKVAAGDRGNSLTGDYLEAWFMPMDSGPSALQRLVVKDNALAADARGGSLAARSLEVMFAPPEPGKDPAPRAVSASGGVTAQREGTSIECGALDAALARDERNDITVTTVDARDQVRFRRDDGVHAEAEVLHADAVKQIVDLSGENALVGKDADNVYGSQIRLDGLARSLEVFGAGRFEHQSFDPAGLPIARADASWKNGMTFDDRRGELNASGEVVAVNEPDDVSVETLHAERIKLFLTPLDESEAAAVEPAPADGAPTGKQAATRDLLTAQAIGAEIELGGGPRATAELRRYESAAARRAGAAPQQLQYLESSRILADNRAGTLNTPGPGKLLVVDRRRPDSARPAEPAPAGTPDTSRGDALFDWKGSMTMTRADGLCRMDQGVKMTHSALADGALTELECETLTARIREEPREGPPAVDLSGTARSVNGRLVEANAAGAVYIRSQGKELLADGVTYRAEARTVEAWANDANVVTLFDPGNPAPLTARRLFWDLATDRIEIREAGTIVAPR